MDINPLIKEHLTSLLAFGAFSLFFLYIAIRKRFFRIDEPFPNIQVNLKEIIYTFGGYLLISFFIAPLLVKVLFAGVKDPSMGAASETITWITFIQLFSILLTAIYFFILINRLSHMKFKYIWKNSTTSALYDFGIGMTVWLVSFPVVNFFYELTNIFNILIFGKEGPQQTAVIYIKMALASPLLFAISLFCVIIGAPIIEETLFRGFLHNFLRNRVGVKATILLSSIIFSLFHFSFRQEIGNFPLLISLFVFALFLGLLYERQKSLWASIGLHMTFNLISILRILFID